MKVTSIETSNDWTEEDLDNVLRNLNKSKSVDAHGMSNALLIYIILAVF